MRRVVPDFEPHVRVSREEAREKHRASRRAFLTHSNDCDECREVDGHFAGQGTGSLFLVASDPGGFELDG